MVSAISGVNSYYTVYRYARTAGMAAGQKAQMPPVSGTAITRHQGADPDTPVSPVRPIPPVNPDTPSPAISLGPSRTETLAAEMAVRMRIQYADSSAEPGAYAQASGIEDVQKAGEKGRCETCEKRKYQDGSDDPSVSFQTPTRIDPDTAASAVRGHEMEHVFHEQARAEQENRKVVSQSVMLHTGICPECGRVYVSGGTTRTVTKADSQEEAPEQETAGTSPSPAF